MKTLFNRKSWLFTLSIALFASSVSTTVSAQDNTSIETEREVTIIKTTSGENSAFFNVQSAPNNNKDHSSYSYTWTANSTKGAKPKLGVLLEGSESGTVILKIFPNSTAEEAGLQKGDKIISLNGKKAESMAGLIQLIGEHQVGDQVTIQYERGGVLKTSNGTFKKASENHYLNRRTNYYNYNYTYKTTEELTENPCEKLETIYGRPFLGVYLSTSGQEDGTGALLTSIISGTGAYDAVLMAADKITKMNSTAVTSTKEAIAFIQSKKPGDKVRIKLIRDGQPMTINATLGSWADNPNTMRKVRILEENCNENATEEVIEEAIEEEEEEKVKVPAKKAKTNSFDTQSVMEVFPNPTPDFVNIKFQGVKAPLSINIISLDGKEMYSKTIQNFDGNYNDQLDLSKYPSGVYLINLKQNDQQTTQQVVVE